MQCFDDVISTESNDYALEYLCLIVLTLLYYVISLAMSTIKNNDMFYLELRFLLAHTLVVRA